MDEFAAIAFAGLVVLLALVGVPVLLVILYTRTNRIAGLAERLARLEHLVGTLRAETGAVSGQPVSTADTAVPPALSIDSARAASAGAAPIAPAAQSIPRPTPVADRPPAHTAAIDWEGLIGRKALGWVAVVVLLFATAFFLRYAFENGWIGPLGRVSVGIAGGLALVAAGWRYHRRGWRAFSQMLTAAGVVLLYLATFSAFGFYHLLPQREASLFLILIVVESGLLALRYDAPAIALMGVIGGLLTPVLMHSDRDQYRSLFTYLAVLDAGVVALLLRRAWPAVGSVALVGTQAIFWAWYSDNYHYAKLDWAIGFQAVVFALFLLHAVLVNVLRQRRATWEDLARLLVNTTTWFAAAYVLLRDDYRHWLGSLAIVMAIIYALVARISLLRARDGGRLALVSLAVAVSFIALAFPLEADTPWVALGWAVEGAVLWWFGLRVKTTPLRAMGAVFAVLMVLKILSHDVDSFGTAPAWPIANGNTLPALAAVACLATAIVVSRRFFPQLKSGELVAVGMAAVGCVLLVWYIVSLDLYEYLRPRGPLLLGNGSELRLAEMSLSIWWATYATVILAAGFLARQQLLRWTALGLYALTVAKVFLYDMQGLDEIYRIAAFFVLAVVLAAAAWAYQRFQPDRGETHAKS